MKSGLLAFTLCLAVSAGMLLWVYPWHVYVRGDFPWERTLASYLLLSIIMAVLIGPLSFVLARRHLRGVERWVGVAALFVATNLLLLLAPVILFSGPGLFLDIPGTRVRGIFFAEWKFATFYFYVGVPAALITAIIQTVVRRGSKTGES